MESGSSESMAPFTAPVIEPVLRTAQNAVSPAPKRSSLPSRFGPLSQAARAGLPPCSAAIATEAPAAISAVTSSSNRVLWRLLPRKRPKASMLAAGMATIAQVLTRLVSPLGFSKGWAELAP